MRSRPTLLRGMLAGKSGHVGSHGTLGCKQGCLKKIRGMEAVGKKLMRRCAGYQAWTRDAPDIRMLTTTTIRCFGTGRSTARLYCTSFQLDGTQCGWYLVFWLCNGNPCSRKRWIWRLMKTVGLCLCLCTAESEVHPYPSLKVQCKEARASLEAAEPHSRRQC